jgi:hypothetical protein
MTCDCVWYSLLHITYKMNCDFQKHGLFDVFAMVCPSEIAMKNNLKYFFFLKNNKIRAEDELVEGKGDYYVWNFSLQRGKKSNASL